MAAYKYLQKAWKSPSLEIKQKVRKWAKQPVVKKLESPTRADKARMLGYKAKQGFLVARTRIKKGMRRRQTPMKGRKPRSMGLFYTSKMSKRAIVERRVARKFPNLEVLNSYFVGESGTHEFYEVILIDVHHPSVVKDKDVNVLGQRRRAFRGLTAAGKKSRNLL